MSALGLVFVLMDEMSNERSVMVTFPEQSMSLGFWQFGKIGTGDGRVVDETS